MGWWLRLAERVVPAEVFTGFGLVPWRIIDDATDSPVGLFGFGGFRVAVSRELLNDSPFDWYGPRWHWKRWPAGSLWDLFPVVGTTVGLIEYHKGR